MTKLLLPVRKFIPEFRCSRPDLVDLWDQVDRDNPKQHSTVKTHCHQRHKLYVRLQFSSLAVPSLFSHLKDRGEIRPRTFSTVQYNAFYRTTHISAKRGMLSHVVCLSVRL